MRTINTFKQGHAFLIKCLQKHSEPMGGEGRGGRVVAWSTHEGNLSYEPEEEKKRNKELGKAEREKNWKEKVMSGSWFEEFLRPHKGPWHHQVLKCERRRRGSLKSWPLTQAVITFVLNMPNCSYAVYVCVSVCAFGGGSFSGVGAGDLN